MNPVDAPVSQEFGENPTNYAPFGLLGHEGRDYACPTGTPVHAVVSGVVGVAATWPTSYGNVIIIHDQNGGGEIYGHLQDFNVGQGQYVNAGDIIGWSGYSGNVRPAGPAGAHLHFGWQPSYMANLQNGYWGCADPRVLLAQGANMGVPQEVYDRDIASTANNWLTAYNWAIRSLAAEAYEAGGIIDQKPADLSIYHGKSPDDVVNSIRALPGYSLVRSDAQARLDKVVKDATT